MASSLETGYNKKVGVDVEDIVAINIENDTFVERNFTDKEIAYCRKSPSPQSSFAGRWSAKEAVFKSLGVKSRGAGAPLKDIEILPNKEGAPVVFVSR
jgi:fatty acid synthase subunit alpha